MIKANELRIGNWFMSAKHNVPFQWQASDFEEAYNTEANPIPLTSEILEKCGLTKSDKAEITYTLSLFTDLPEGKIHRYYKSGISKPKYLHQLQNLYFALCGKELNIQL